MDISIGNLTISSFSLQNSLHIKFVKELKKDELIYDFVSTHLITDFMESRECQQIEIGKTYLLKREDTLIGFIQLKELLDQKHIIELRASIDSKFRNKGYGAQMLEECSQFLLEKCNYEAIELHIRQDNDSSIRSAEKAKYKNIGVNEKEYYYIYQKRKHD